MQPVLTNILPTYIIPLFNRHQKIWDPPPSKDPNHFQVRIHNGLHDFS